jgi:predicted ATPase
MRPTLTPKLHKEVAEIKSKELNLPWPKFLRSISIGGLRGWTGQEIRFAFPVVAVAGENGSGKSTVLKVAACAYQQAKEKIESFTPSQFFLDTAWDEVSGVSLVYKLKEGDKERTYTHKRLERWKLAERARREVVFQDISRTLPLEATSRYAYIANRNQKEKESVFLTPELTSFYSSILGRRYDEARIAVTEKNIFLPVGVVKQAGTEYSQFHQGAGEDATLDLLSVLQSASNTSLIIIDEVEASLHPRAQRRLMHFLLWIARSRQIQVIVSTHSPYVLEELPAEARIFLHRGAQEIDVLYGVSPNYALNRMDDYDRPDLYVFTEDSESSILIREILRYKEVSLDRVIFMEIGPADMVQRIGALAHHARFPVPSLGVLDADQKSSDGCVVLPGNQAPEKQLFADILDTAISHLAMRLEIPESLAFDALASACSLSDHHLWIPAAARALRVGEDYLWQTLCQIWVKNCADLADLERISQQVSSIIEGPSDRLF